MTRDRIWFESGLQGTRTESVPMWAVKDVDVRQSVWQRGKDVGDVVLTLEDPAYATGPAATFSVTGESEQGHTRGQVVLDDVQNPYGVVDIISPLISEARHRKTVERQSQYLRVDPGATGGVPGVPAPQPPSAPQPDLADQLRKLADLRDAGILTEAEFAAQKAKLLA